MTHRNSPLTPAGRLRLVQRVERDGRPIAHVAAEAGVARSTLTKWVYRYRDDGCLDTTHSGGGSHHSLDGGDDRLSPSGNCLTSDWIFLETCKPLW